MTAIALILTTTHRTVAAVIMSVQPEKYVPIVFAYVLPTMKIVLVEDVPIYGPTIPTAGHAVIYALLDRYVIMVNVSLVQIILVLTVINVRSTVYVLVVYADRDLMNKKKSIWETSD